MRIVGGFDSLSVVLQAESEHGRPVAGIFLTLDDRLAELSAKGDDLERVKALDERFLETYHLGDAMIAFVCPQVGSSI